MTSLDEIWASLSAVICKAAVYSNSFKHKNHHNWFDESSERTTAFLDSMHKAHAAALNNPTSPNLKRRWQLPRTEAQVTTQAAIRMVVYERAGGKDIQILVICITIISQWKTIYDPKNCNLTPQRSSDGSTLIKDQNLTMERWAEHFKGLLNQPNPTNPIVLQEFSDHYPSFTTWTVHQPFLRYPGQSQLKE